jgi:uncharacterized protein (TIGR00369 family)
MTDIDHATFRELFRSAPFIVELGLELESFGTGECVTSLNLEQRHLQQNGFVHAGVQATLADHTAGAAAGTLAAEGRHVMTVEFKISFFRAAKGERLVCRAKVIKPGRKFSFVESEVFCVSLGEERLVAKASATMAILAPAGE